MTVAMKKPEINPKRVFLPEDQCERMVRREFEAMRCLLGAVSYAGHAGDDLQKRLEAIPYGKQRMKMLLGSIRAIADDLIGTMPRNQCRQLKNTMLDMEIRMVPKLTGQLSQNVIIERDIAKGLIDTAMEKCRDCVEDGESCKKCPLYKLLEGIMPMEDYSELRCPYSVTELED